jgi:hypothetical protein
VGDVDWPNVRKLITPYQPTLVYPSRGESCEMPDYVLLDSVRTWLIDPLVTRFNDTERQQLLATIHVLGRIADE